jgi:SAM-dependent methyltransferase
MKISELFRLIMTVGVDGVFRIQRGHKDSITYARGFVCSYAMSTFLNTGIIDDIESEGGIEPTVYGKRRQFNLTVFLPLCDYLYSLGILELRDSKLILSPSGHRLAKLSIGVFDLLYAYSPIFHNLESLLKNEKSYGREIARYPAHVAKGSTEITRYLPFPAARKLIRKHQYKSVLDLGCGDGAFLFYINEDECQGVGIDLAEKAIKVANQRALARNQSDRLRFYAVDIFDLQRIRCDLPATFDVVSIMFVLHELLFKGELEVTRILDIIRENFPTSDLLVCELCEHPSSDLKRTQTTLCEHFLYHQLSNQRITTKEKWVELFNKAGYRVKDAVFFDFAAQGYFLLSHQ